MEPAAGDLIRFDPVKLAPKWQSNTKAPVAMIGMSSIEIARATATAPLLDACKSGQTGASMENTVSIDRPAGEGATRSQERRVLGVVSSAHLLHDGYTDLIWVALPIWQAEFGLTYAAVGALRMIYSGTMASLQIPASYAAERMGSGTVLALGTALSGV